MAGRVGGDGLENAEAGPCQQHDRAGEDDATGEQWCDQGQDRLLVGCMGRAAGPYGLGSSPLGRSQKERVVEVVAVVVGTVVADEPVCGDDVLSGTGSAPTSGGACGAGVGWSCESVGATVEAGPAPAGVGMSSTQPA